MIFPFLGFSKRNGRNFTGRITIRHRGGGNKKAFLTSTNNISGVFSRIALRPLYFLNSTHSYFVSATSYPNIYSVVLLPVPKYYSLPSPIYVYPTGSRLVNLSSNSSFGKSVFVRSRGCFAQLLRKRGTKSLLKMPSGELRRFSIFCTAFRYREVIRSPPIPTSAGFSRRYGIRPHVKGNSINPVDHPHGGRTGESRSSVSPWGILTKGYRTRVKPFDKKLVTFSVRSLKNKYRHKL